jgi:hypothetical protein
MSLRCLAVPDGRQTVLSISPYLREKIPFNDQMGSVALADRSWRETGGVMGTVALSACVIMSCRVAPHN